MIKKKFHLSTTRLLDTWSLTKKNILLNKGCLDISKEQQVKKFNFLILNHPWDDRKKLIESINYLDNLSDRILPNLSQKLNSLHNKKYSSKFWIIVLKRWLDLCINVFYERWLSIENFEEKYNNFSFKIIDTSKKKFEISELEDFNLLIRTDIYNHHLYSLILKYKKLTNYELIDYKEEYFSPHIKYWYNRNIITKIALNVLNFINYLFLRKSKIFLYDTYLGHINEFYLSSKLGIFGKPFVRFGCKNNLFDIKKREKIKIDLKPNNKFEEFIFSILHEFIPKSYVENFDSIFNVIKSFNWPENPKLIFTSHGMVKDVVAFYIAKKCEKGSKLILGQHGGSYFQFQEHWGEKNELKFSDKFISWGHQGNKKIYNVGILKPLKLRKKNLEKGYNLFIIKSSLNYTGLLNSSSGINQHYKYLEDTVKFAKNLNKENLENLKVRFHSRKLGCNEELFWKKELGKFNYDDGRKKIDKLYKHSRLVIHSYAVTGYLETLAMNIPTIIFHNFKDSPFNEVATSDIQELIKYNILHTNTKSAAIFLNKISNDIDSWWNDPNLQKAKNDFSNKYGRFEINKINKLKQFLINS